MPNPVQLVGELLPVQVLPGADNRTRRFERGIRAGCGFIVSKIAHDLTAILLDEDANKRLVSGDGEAVGNRVTFRNCSPL